VCHCLPRIQGKLFAKSALDFFLKSTNWFLLVEAFGLIIYIGSYCGIRCPNVTRHKGWLY